MKDNKNLKIDDDPKKEAIPIEQVISLHRSFSRNYSPKELLGEITNLIQSGHYEDFMFVAEGIDGFRSIRIGSKDKDLRIGDLLVLNELIKQDIMEMLRRE